MGCSWHNFTLAVRPVSDSGADGLDSSSSVMPYEMLALATSRYLECQMRVYAFNWQGREPTLAGLDFFREAVRLQKKYMRPGQKITNFIQTDGTLLNREWAEFFYENNFLVAVSLDGPEQIHEAGRNRKSGSFRKTMRGIELLQKMNVRFNIVTVVSSVNQDHPQEVYSFFKGAGITFQHYVEHVDFESEGVLSLYSVTPGRWGGFMSSVFDMWHKDDTRRISISLFDSIISRLSIGQHTLCSMSENCCRSLVVLHNGEIYPCDMHVDPDFRLGHMTTDFLSTVFELETYKKWGKAKKPLHPYCLKCRFLFLCMGGCPAKRSAGKNALCSDWEYFFSRTITRFENIIDSLAGKRTDFE